LCTATLDEEVGREVQFNDCCDEVRPINTFAQGEALDSKVSTTGNGDGKDIREAYSNA